MSEDLIRRDDAIKTVAEVLSLNRFASFKNVKDFGRFAERMLRNVPSAEAKEYINSAPSIDIVRCKECKHKPICSHSVQHTTHEPTSVTIGYKSVDFCSYGERDKDTKSRKDQTMSNLKPCPFCGRTPKVENCKDFGYFVNCKCGIEQSTLYAQRCDAVKRWNKRKGADNE